ncbi:MAG: TIGR00153 family protein [Wenzhouxiangella sp.]|nr:MAG: TIGR00153 family protein [Wenzhouxiangella sp.]
MNTSGYISRIFGTSPVRPLQKHMDKAAKCAHKLPKLIKASYQGDWNRAAAAREKIVLLEHAADDLKRDLRLSLPKSLLMPVSRTDVLDMLSRQDRIANRAKDISGLIMGRRIVFPAPIQTAYLEFLERNLDAVTQARKSVHELDTLYESGFRGAEADLVVEMIDELSRLEDQSDELQIKLRASLFAIERDLHAVDVMFLYKVIDRTGDLGDMAQRVGSRLHMMIAR